MSLVKKMSLAKKMAGQGGETLVELLASILIGTLSIALLIGSVVASSRMDTTARQGDGAHYETLTAAEQQQTPLAMPEAEVKITLLNPDPLYVMHSSNPRPLKVLVYGGQGLYSYKIET